MTERYTFADDDAGAGAAGNADERTYNSYEIADMIKAMDASKARHAALKDEGRTEEYFEAVKADCPVLHEHFPSIFEPHIEDRLPGEVYYLLAHLRHVEEGKQTVAEADVKIGKKMAKDYVYPHIKNLDAPRYGDYVNKKK